MTITAELHRSTWWDMLVLLWWAWIEGRVSVEMGWPRRRTIKASFSL